MNKIYLTFFSFLFLITTSAQAKMYHHSINTQQFIYEWQEENNEPFDELILSFNGLRPIKGEYQFYISLKGDNWSQELLYATWSSHGQETYDKRAGNAPVQVYQDGINVLEGKKATGFKIKVVSTESNLENLFHLHAYTNSDFTKEEKVSSLMGSLSLEVKGLSQMTLNHVKYQNLCSPTSTTAALRFLTKNDSIDPCQFAQNVLDQGFDIYGNWIFATAEAFTYLGSTWNAWVERLKGFEDIVEQLNKHIPVVISMKGPLKGSALPYLKGHLIAIIGYDEKNDKVLCMDPAFNTTEETKTSYDLKDFMEAWNRRGRVAYIFHQ